MSVSAFIIRKKLFWEKEKKKDGNGDIQSCFWAVTTEAEARGPWDTVTWKQGVWTLPLIISSEGEDEEETELEAVVDQQVV